ncbi:MAG: hypothetical protein K6C98_04615 [Treponema sp.]|nr:hypothetical protein [Treponema sp.]
MKVRVRIIKFSSILISTLIIGLTSCAKKTDTAAQNSLQVQISDSSISEIQEFPHSHTFTNKKILVLFGYDFNSEAFENEMLGILSKNYGLYEDGGIIYPLRFPEDFKRGGRSYATELYNILSDPEIEFGGILLLGAPEHSHLALARNQDLWNQNVPFPVISVFPQDDNLGIESTCDFIIDKTQNTDISDELNSEEVAAPTVTDETKKIIFNIIEHTILCDFSFQDFPDISYHMAKVIKDAKYHNYTDPETGLKSVNHFVLD